MINTWFALCPFIIGWIALLSLIRPLFAGRARWVEPQRLNPDQNPAVYHLTREICQQLGAREPRRIEVSSMLNASARLERGWRGFFGGSLVLTLGLPLVNLLTQRELAGVIAHELGHFRQQTGMRTTWIIRTINGWFARVVYTRGAFDPAMEERIEGFRNVSLSGGIMVFCAQLGTLFGRSVLWLLMMIGHLVAGVLLRQMEYDADHYEVRVAGSAAFESASTKLRVAGAAFRHLVGQLNEVWHVRRRLPDDLAGLLKSRVHSLADVPQPPEPPAARLVPWLATHPNMVDRVRRARRLAERGGHFSDAPAYEIFGNFEALSRRVTVAYYEDDLNLPISKRILVPYQEWMPLAPADRQSVYETLYLRRGRKPPQTAVEQPPPLSLAPS